MKVKNLLSGIAILVTSFLLVFSVNAAELVAHQQGAKLVAIHQGGVLPNAPDYDWWYGCSATSAGMMMGFYDINGYGGLDYDNLVPGGTAETSLFGTTGLANDIIASAGHISDFWTGFGNSGDDPNPTSPHSFNSLADFMGTSQDSVGNSDGSTTFWNSNDGSRVYGSDLFAAGEDYYESSGMYGMYEYLNYAGYSVGSDQFYNQYIDSLGLDYGFTLANYKAEIDAGRVVMIHVDGHSMFGYGYDGDNVILHDTWTEGAKTMEWGGSYDGRGFLSVTAFTPGGGTQPGPDPVPPVPEPATMVLFGLGLLGSAFVARRKKEV